MARIKITQTRSAIAREKDQGRTLRALGLHRIGDSVEHEEVADISGMVRKVIHLVKVEPVKGSKQ